MEIINRKVNMLSTKGLIEVMISHTDVTIDYESSKLQFSKHNPAMPSHVDSDDFITLDDWKAENILTFLQNQFYEESILLHSVSEDYELDEVQFLDGNKKIDLKLSYKEGSKFSEVPSGTMRLMVYEILENSKVDLVAELPEGRNYNEIDSIELVGEDYNGALELYSFGGDVSIQIGDEKINAYFTSESFGTVVTKMILIETKESDAFIDATNNGFEEEFADDIKYALELISKGGGNG